MNTEEKFSSAPEEAAVRNKCPANATTPIVRRRLGKVMLRWRMRVAGVKPGMTAPRYSILSWKETGSSGTTLVGLTALAQEFPVATVGGRHKRTTKKNHR
jgi:hypothetical protein